MSEKEPLNLYGDKVVSTTGSHGVDIASQRMDDLDKKCIEYALTLHSESNFALDVGCGLGIQGIRMAVLGLDTLLIDLMDISETVNVLSTNLGVNNLSLLIKDARDLNRSDIYKPPSIVFSQRFIHYLKYDEADKLIKTLSESMPVKSRLFISASGLNSELGNNYKGKTQPIEKRYSVLADDMAEKHHIIEPVCLYTEGELEGLVKKYGFNTVEIWSSSFGNIKSVFEKNKS